MSENKSDFGAQGGLQTDRKTILVLAYSISPQRGSEYAVGWDYVRHMARKHDLIVLYGLAGPHMGDLSEMDGVQLPNVTFVPVHPDALARMLNAPNRAGRMVYSFYIAYRQWHRNALRVAEEICREREVDVVHYLCPIGFREPGFLWKLGKPYIWGPIGGMSPYRWRLMGHAGMASAVKARLRNLMNWTQVNLNPRLIRILRKADVVLAATSDNAQIIREKSGITPILFPENGIVSMAPHQMEESEARPLRLLWVGSLEERKAPFLALEALAKVRSRDWTLDVLGDGPLLEKGRILARHLSIGDRVSFRGRIPRSDVLDHFARADVHLLTSLMEANTTVLWEAMAQGLPTVSFDHCGMGDNLCDECGVRVPLGTVDEMIGALSDALDELVENPGKVRKLRAGTLKCAQNHLWSKRAEFWDEIYDLAIERHAGKGES